jgi:hypothetical protein
MVLMMGVIMITALITTLIRDEEERQRQAAMPAAIARVILEQRRQERGEGHGAPARKRRAFISWNHARARDAVQEDYWAPLPRFNDRMFERVFRVSRRIAEELLNTCAMADPFFRQTIDCTGKVCICPKVKLLMALKILAYGVAPTAFQDYFQMGITTAHVCLKKFCKIISNDDHLKGIYRRRMSRADAKRLSNMHFYHHGVPGMVGSLDCMHIGWRLCPVALQGQYEGKEKKPSLILEAVADYTLWLWHSCFNHPGSLNDINVWDRSPLLQEFLDGTFAEEVDFEFEINDIVFHQVR